MDDFKNEATLFMIFDILGDTRRTGPLLWHIKRERLEDIKDHTIDVMLIARMLKKYLPYYVDFSKLMDYLMFHDLPEAITGDITKFEGVPDEEIERVTNVAINYLNANFGDVVDFGEIIGAYEGQRDLEAKIAKMIDKLHSATTFIKYESEKHVNMDDPRIIPELRNHPFVVKKYNEGADLADIFFEFHMKAINISDDECKKFRITREDADRLVSAIRGFGTELYNRKQNQTLLNAKDDFPPEALDYNTNI